MMMMIINWKHSTNNENLERPESARNVQIVGLNIPHKWPMWIHVSLIQMARMMDRLSDGEHPKS